MALHKKPAQSTSGPASSLGTGPINSSLTKLIEAAKSGHPPTDALHELGLVPSLPSGVYYTTRARYRPGQPSVQLSNGATFSPLDTAGIGTSRSDGFIQASRGPRARGVFGDNSSALSLVQAGGDTGAHAGRPIGHSNAFNWLESAATGVSGAVVSSAVSSSPISVCKPPLDFFEDSLQLILISYLT
ncbi:unnamed protein product [Protopolystoma xenopodis]|uniref:Uncharacterized protein n=1 Tax=Protopolystoma xenopodis TaxID=117903 RepID=A0A448XGD2_9PLAT|nr:unnamed protein product [Protopolystoma xenopodis]